MSRSIRSMLIVAAALAFATLGGALPAQSDDDWQCGMLPSSLRTKIANQGYSNVKLNVPTGGYVQAHGDKGGVSYLLAVNACNGQIVGRRQRGAS